MGQPTPFTRDDRAPLDHRIDEIRERCPGSLRRTIPGPHWWVCCQCGHPFSADNAPEHDVTRQRYRDPRWKLWRDALEHLPAATDPGTRLALHRVGPFLVANRLHLNGYTPSSVDWSMPLPCLRLQSLQTAAGARLWLWATGVDL